MQPDDRDVFHGNTEVPAYGNDWDNVDFGENWETGEF